MLFDAQSLSCPRFGSTRGYFADTKVKKKEKRFGYLCIKKYYGWSPVHHKCTFAPPDISFEELLFLRPNS